MEERRHQREYHYYKQLVEDKMNIDRDIVLSIIRQNQYNESKKYPLSFSSKIERPDLLFFNFLWIYYVDHYFSEQRQPVWRRILFFLIFNLYLYHIVVKEYYLVDVIARFLFMLLCVYVATLLCTIVVEIFIYIYEFIYKTINRNDGYEENRQ